MAHTLTANLGGCHFNAAVFADNALKANALVFAAVTLPVLHRSKDLLAEKTVTFRFQGAVVDGLGLFYLTMGPFANIFSGRQGNLNGVKISGIEICHSRYSLSVVASPTSADAPSASWDRSEAVTSVKPRSLRISTAFFSSGSVTFAVFARLR